MKLREKKPALILIDVQKAFLEEEYWGGKRNNKEAEVVCAWLLYKWRELNLPIFHIRHNSPHPNSKFHESNVGYDFNDLVKPIEDEVVITKTVNSAFIGTDLKKHLQDLNIQTVVIAGLTTDHCVSTTTRMAANYGFHTYLISDATATFDRTGIDRQKVDSEIIHYTALTSLNEEFATVLNSSEMISQL